MNVPYHFSASVGIRKKNRHTAKPREELFAKGKCKSHVNQLNIFPETRKKIDEKKINNRKPVIQKKKRKEK